MRRFERPSTYVGSTLIPAVGGLISSDLGGWMVSSFDLRHGTDVVDDPQGDTIPGALFDELFAQPEEHLKNPGR